MLSTLWTHFPEVIKEWKKEFIPLALHSETPSSEKFIVAVQISLLRVSRGLKTPVCVTFRQASFGRDIHREDLRPKDSESQTMEADIFPACFNLSNEI